MHLHRRALAYQTPPPPTPPPGFYKSGVKYYKIRSFTEHETNKFYNFYSKNDEKLIKTSTGTY